MAKFRGLNKINWSATAVLIALSIFVVFPIYLALAIALKNPEELAKSILAFPTKFHFENFTRAIELTHYWKSFSNSFIITFFAVIFTVITNSIVGYAIVRNMNKKFFKFLNYYFLSAMFVPFPIIMMPLVKQASLLHLNSLLGLIIFYTVFGFSFNTFLYIGYMKTIPKDLEEAALIDGANTWQTFFKVVFPLLKPINATVAILTALWTWNDFMLPLIILKKREDMTLPLVQYIFQGQFNTQFNLSFASYILALLPVLIFYIIAQKQIIGGMLNGAVKG